MASLHFVIQNTYENDVRRQYLPYPCEKVPEFDFLDPKALIGTCISHNLNGKDVWINVISIERSLEAAEAKVVELTPVSFNENSNFSEAFNALQKTVNELKEDNESLKRQVHEQRGVLQRLEAAMKMLTSGSGSNGEQIVEYKPTMSYEQTLNYEQIMNCDPRKFVTIPMAGVAIARDTFNKALEHEKNFRGAILILKEVELWPFPTLQTWTSMPKKTTDKIMDILEKVLEKEGKPTDEKFCRKLARSIQGDLASAARDLKKYNIKKMKLEKS